MTKIRVEFLDGAVENYETGEQMAVNGPVLVIGQGDGSYVAICLSQVRKWEAVASKIQVAGSLPGPAIKN